MSSEVCVALSSLASSASGTFTGASRTCYPSGHFRRLTTHSANVIRDDPSTRPADPDPFGLGLDVSDVRVAWDRATGRSLGSVCLGAGVSGCLLGLKYGAEAARRVCLFERPAMLILG